MKPWAFSCVAAAAFLTGAAHAEPILASDPTLEALAAGYERQQDTFARSESGQNFDAFIKPSDMQLVTDFFAQGADFQTFAGRHAFDVIESFDEHGDMGNFSGIASVGLAARLMVLKRDNAPAQEITRARDACVRAARTWHVFGTIAGQGTIARGVRRIAPVPGEPALPGATPALVPLKDANGAPLPPSKGDTWRAPVAPGYSAWIWRDNTSKDQVSGYALGVLWLWEALHDDPAAPADAWQDIAADLTRFAKVLMTVDSDKGLDLVVRDADGRLTSYGDLNARLVSGSNGIALGENSSLKNGFNAALAMGVIRAAVHVGKDKDVEKYYYEELVGRRDYARHAVNTATLMYTGENTNFSNVNMLAIALATLGRIETDKTIRDRLYELVDKFWGTSSRAASNTEQPWFDVIVAGFGRAPKTEVPARMKNNLGGHSPAPTFQRDRINCDAAEISARSCLAVDGTTTITLAASKGWGGGPVATALVPLSVRPDTNFLWRSDPYSVNDGGGNRLNPRGDWLAAYWLGRLLDRDPSKNLSPTSTPPIPIPPPNPTDSGEEDPGAVTTEGSDAGDGGCGCKMHQSPEDQTAAVAALSMLALAIGRRRRQSS